MNYFFKLAQLHRWFTYSFCHSGLGHLTNNIVSKALLGLLLEFQHKVCFVIPLTVCFHSTIIFFQSTRLFFIYFAGVISGSLLFSVINCGTTLVGSSAGAFALFGAAFIDIKRTLNFRGTQRTLCHIILVVLCTLSCSAELASSVYNWYNCKDLTTAISAHVGGLLAGKFNDIV